MFHWICPECGREIPPSVKQCSNCDPQAAPPPPPQAEPELVPVAVAQAVAEAPLLAEAEPLPEAQPLPETHPIAEAEAPVAEGVPAAAEAAPLASQALQAAAETAQPAHETARPVEPGQSVDAEQAAVAVATPPPPAPPPIPLHLLPDQGDVLLGLAQKLRDAQREALRGLQQNEVQRSSQETAAALDTRPSAHEPPPLPELASALKPALVLEPAPPPPPEPAPEPQAEPLPEPQLELVSVAAVENHAHAVPVVESLAPPLAVLPPSTLLLAAPLTAVALLAPVEEPVAIQPQIELPEFAALAPITETVAPPPKPAPPPEPPPKPATAPEPVDPASAGRVRTPEPSFSAAAPPAKTPEEPAALPTATLEPPSVKPIEPARPALTLAPLQDSTAIGNRIRPAHPSLKIMRAEPGPRITLPGPALPKALNSLEDAGISKILVDRPRQVKSGSRAWVTGALAAVALVGCLVGLDLYNAPRSDASVNPPPVETQRPPAASSAPAPSAPGPPAPAVASTSASFPLSKAVEVTGLRFVGDKKPEVRYLVVNHSPAELGSVTVYVTIHSSSSKLPLYHFSFRSPSLAPYESKEMASSIDKIVHPASEWQNLRADVEIGQ